MKLRNDQKNQDPRKKNNDDFCSVLKSYRIWDRKSKALPPRLYRGASQSPSLCTVVKCGPYLLRSNDRPKAKCFTSSTQSANSMISNKRRLPPLWDSRRSYSPVKLCKLVWLSHVAWCKNLLKTIQRVGTTKVRQQKNWMANMKEWTTCSIQKLLIADQVLDQMVCHAHGCN